MKKGVIALVIGVITLFCYPIQAEEKKATPITYKIEIEIIYEDLYARDASKLIPYLIERFKDAKSFKVKMTRSLDDDSFSGFMIPTDEGFIYMPNGIWHGTQDGDKIK